MIECRECGLQLAEGARFCRACGTPVTGEQPAASGPRPDPDGGYWAAVGRAGAERVGGAPAATATVPPPPAGPTHVAPAAVPPPRPPSRRAGLIVAAVIGALVVLALAVLVGYQLTRQDSDDGQGAARSSTTSPGSSAPPGSVVVKPAAVDASCTGADSRDAAGHVTSYEPARAVDGDEATAWRCDDDGVGQTLRIRFDRAVHLGSVGLVPGIVKVDPADGTDRFVQNNKIAEVRWVFDGGKTATQSFEPKPDLQRTAVDVTTETVTVEIRSVFPGKVTPNDHGQGQKPTRKSPIAEIELRGTP